MTRQAHHRLLAAHLDRLARTPTGAAADPADRITVGLDRLERGHATAARGLTR